MDDLRTLVNTVSETPAYSGQLPNSSAFDYRDNYWFALQEEATISVNGVTSRVGITECTIDEYRQKIDDPFSEHKLHYNTAKPLRIYNNSQVELVYDDGYTITYYHLTYLKNPATVDNVPAGTTDCDLPEHTHDEIVKIATSMMLENIEQPRYRTHMAEVGTME